jgi:hypothetical protein
MKRPSSRAAARPWKASNNSDISGAIQTILEKPVGASASASLRPVSSAVVACASSKANQPQNHGHRSHAGMRRRANAAATRAQHQAPAMHHVRSAKYSMPEPRL